MFIEEISTRESLYRIVRRLTRDTSFHEDLMQEALLHLWLREARYPGQTKSFYLQSCKFHLQHYIDSGRSVDSVKRRSGQIPLLEDDEGETPLLEHWTSEHSIFSQISATELLTLLGKRLKPREKAILDCLADGLGAREIARKLKITHPTAIKSRRKIAKLVIELGFSSSGQPAARLRINGAAKRAQAPLRTNGNTYTKSPSRPLNGEPRFDVGL